MERLNFVIAVILAGLGGYGLGALSVPQTTGAVTVAPPIQVKPAPAPALQVAEVAPAKPAPRAAPPKPAPKAPPKVDRPLPPPPDLKAPLLEQLPRIGKADAPVVVLVVSDFQCPVCKRAAALLSSGTEVAGPLGGRVRNGH